LGVGNGSREYTNRTIFGSALHTVYTFADFRNGEQIFRHYVAVERINTVDSKALTPTPAEKALLQAHQIRCAMRYHVILQVAASFLK
jgi:hypothetical protein